MVDVSGFHQDAPKKYEDRYESDSNPRASAMDEMRSYGFQVPPVAVIGDVQRVATADDTHKKQSGWYIYQEFPDFYNPGAYVGVCVFGSWKGHPEKVVWSSKRRENMTTEEAGHMARCQEEAKAKRDEQKRQDQEAARITAQQIWDAAVPIESHPYLTNKGVNPNGLRVSTDPKYDSLIATCRDEHGALMSLQFISTDGKRFLSGGRIEATAYQVGDTVVDDQVYVAEGWATAATIHEATGSICYAAFNTGNLMNVAGWVKDKHADAIMVICGDDDRWTDGNPGRSYGTAAANVTMSKIVFPEFESLDDKPTDFNDLAKLEGKECVRDLIEKRTRSSLPAKTYDDSFDPAALPKRRWLLLGVFLRGYITAAIAPPGVGKSLFALAMAIMVATGRSLMKRKLIESANVLYINNEDDEDEGDRRVAATCLEHEVPFIELNNKLFMMSGYGDPCVVAHKLSDGTVVAHPDAQRIIEFCLENNIGLIILDPFISTHRVQENDNTEIDAVIQEYRKIAKATDAAVLLVHHTRKGTGDSEAHAGDPDAGRGASSLTGAARNAFTLARMSRSTSDKHGLEWELGNRLIRMDDGKSNFALKADKAEWYELVSTDIKNGDSVGVPVPFDMENITKRAEEEKAAEKTEQKQVKVTDIALDVVTCMTSDEQPQSEIIAAYRNHTDKGRTAANDAIALLPVGRANSVRIFDGGVAVRVWRTRTGSNAAPRYTIHRETEV